MNADWIGLIFLILFVLGAFAGLKILSKSRTSTENEFEKRASESTSMLSSGIEALAGMLNPSAAKGKEAVVEVKRGDYSKKKEDGRSFVNKKGEK